MLCPKCGGKRNRVIDTNGDSPENIVIRTRKCLACGYSWRTEEKIEVFEKRDRKHENQNT